MSIKCAICDIELRQEMLMTVQDDIVLGFHAIVIKNVQLPICADCSRRWNKVLEFLISRFKEQKCIDEEICQKILEFDK